MYGATTGGGGIATPTLFRITPEEAVELFHTSTLGVSNGGLLQASDGHLYGTTVTGANIIFRITLDGILTPLHSGVPSRGNLLEGFGGVIFGTTDSVYGYPNWGTVFKITPDGTLTTLHEFDAAGGRRPRAGLVRGADGHLYGTTYAGGSHDLGTFYRLDRAFRGQHRARSPVFGPLPGFGPALLLNFPSLAGLPAGDYYWFMIVAEGSTRVFADYVKTVVP